MLIVCDDSQRFAAFVIIPAVPITALPIAKFCALLLPCKSTNQTKRCSFNKQTSLSKQKHSDGCSRGGGLQLAGARAVRCALWALRCAALGCAALRSAALRCKRGGLGVMQCAARGGLVVMQCAVRSLRFAELQTRRAGCDATRCARRAGCDAMRCAVVALRCVALRCAELRCAELRCKRGGLVVMQRAARGGLVVMQCAVRSLRCAALRCAALRCAALRCAEPCF